MDSPLLLCTLQEPLESILFSMGFISTLGAAIGCLVVPGEQLAAPPQMSGWVYLAATTLLALAVQVGGSRLAVGGPRLAVASSGAVPLGPACLPVSTAGALQ